MRRWLRAGGLALVVIVFGVPALTLGLAATETGSRWLVRGVAAALPDTLQIETFTGTLLRGIRAGRIGVSAPQFSLRIESLDFEWTPFELLRGRLVVDSVALEGFDYTAIPTRETPAASPASPRWPLPVELVLGPVRIERIAIAGEGEPLELERIELAGGGASQQVMRLDGLVVKAPKWQVAGAGRIGGAAPHEVEATLTWHAMIESSAQARGIATISGDLHTLRFEHALEAPFGAQVKGSAELGATPVQVDLSGDWRNARWPLAGEPAYRSPQGSFSFDGKFPDLRLVATGEFQRPGMGVDSLSAEINAKVDVTTSPYPFDGQLEWSLGMENLPTVNGTARVFGDTTRFEFEHRVNPPLALTTRGQLSLGDPQPRFRVEGEWEGLGWPLFETPTYSSPSGTYLIEGTPERVDYTVSAGLEGPPGLEVEDLKIDVRGTADGRAPFPFSAEVQWGGAVQSQVLTGIATIEGNQHRTTFDHRIAGAFELGTVGQVDWSVDPLSVSLDGRWKNLRWPLPPESPAQFASPAGELSLAGDLSDLRASLEAMLDHQVTRLRRVTLAATTHLSPGEVLEHRSELGWSIELEDHTEVRGAGRLEGAGRRLRVDHRVEAPFTLTTAGDVQLEDRGPVLALRGAWEQARWPFGTGPSYASERGSYELKGPPERLEIELDAAAAGPGIPPMDVALSAVSTGTQLNLESLGLDTLGGRVEARGAVSWAPVVNWDLQIQAAGIDPGRHWAQWPGKLKLDGATKGSLAQGEPTMTAQIRTLEGTLRDYPVSGRGSVSLAGQTMAVDNLRLSSGVNWVEVRGSVGDRAELDFDLGAPTLAELWPGLTGELTGTGRVNGPRANPEITASARGQSIAYSEFSLESLTLEANLDPRNPAGSQLQLRVKALEGPAFAISNLDLDGAGNLERHDVAVTVSADVGEGSANMTGGYSGDAWAGSLESMRATSKATGDWMLERPAAVKIGRDSAETSEMCLVQAAARACVDGRWAESGDISGNASLSALPLALADRWLPPDLEITGAVDGRVIVSRKKGHLRMDATIASTAGKFALRADEGPIELEHRDAAVNLNVADERAKADLAINLGDGGYLRARADLNLSPSGDGGYPLDSRVEGQLPDVALVAALSPKLAEVKGRVEWTADVRGTTRNPKLDGTARVLDAGAQVPDLGLELTRANITVRNRGTEELAFDATVNSGEGQITIRGATTLSAEQSWPLTVELVGEGVEVLRLPIAHVLASPDLRVTGNAKQLDVRGRIKIPSAEITPRQIPQGAVKVSADEVIVDAQSASDVEAKTRAPGGPVVEINLDLDLGEAVYFDGFGLSARLGGSLKLSQVAGQPPSAQGQLEIHDGRFKAYGQNLSIERGRLIFAGPIDNPGLDIRATRKAGNVTAGIEIGGTAKDLRSRVYSEPALSEAEALSYLLTGGPLAGASEGQAGALMQAAVSLGMERSQVITEQLKTTFGLDEVTVGSAGGLDQSALILGKRLSPDLYLRYALGIFDTVGALLLNYRLTDSLSVEAESGARQGMDLIYKIERDSIWRANP